MWLSHDGADKSEARFIFKTETDRLEAACVTSEFEVMPHVVTWECGRTRMPSTAELGAFCWLWMSCAGSGWRKAQGQLCRVSKTD